ncbi:hypothetical protein KUTeg_017296 [Tegillarca granosa]|uniref:Alpha-2-macroglobulin bait region domain-containing protein n=1 Tax=Tegillarca granosa TaxID=220873 RepID=A0ABQ9ELB1_TEGGR|nr:hypothetical protein KUTeg_017296 [Tegillarca granosa]
MAHYNLLKQMGDRQWDTLSHFNSPFMRNMLMVGAKANFRLKTTRPLNGTFYQVLSRGNAVKTGFINLQNNLTAYFDMQITPEMAPIAKVILYALEEQSGQIFADSATINVDGTLQNKVASDIIIMCCEQRYVRFVKTK